MELRKWKTVGVGLMLSAGWGFGGSVAVSASGTGEMLGRGAVAVRVSPDTVMVGWRYLSSDPLGAAFNVYRDGLLVTPRPVAVSTQFYDYNPSRAEAFYEVRPVVDGREVAASAGIDGKMGVSSLSSSQ